ncbi:MAG: hypothetical protein JEZ00_15445 [Anaerolineaceae bacterium]|nr:hypothetical protein [Anaerolineaceae bacterium]
MKKSKIILLLTFAILSIAMIACAIGGGNNDANNTGGAEVEQEQAAPEEAVEEPAQEEAASAEAAVETDFPILPDAEGLTEMQGTVIFQSKTSLADAFDFYQKEFTSQGFTENEILTLNEETMFQLVFTGSDDGKSLVVQTIQLDDSTINVTLRYE